LIPDFGINIYWVSKITMDCKDGNEVFSVSALGAQIEQTLPEIKLEKCYTKETSSSSQFLASTTK
jgi:hypothetical protein